VGVDSRIFWTGGLDGTKGGDTLPRVWYKAANASMTRRMRKVSIQTMLNVHYLVRSDLKKRGGNSSRERATYAAVVHLTIGGKSGMRVFLMDLKLNFKLVARSDRSTLNTN